jgi:four helix bundle protein
MPFLFEKLEVYQKAVDLAATISKLTDIFPKGNYYLIDQLNRAALSISANLAEGNGRWHENDRKQFFYIARGSAQECVPLLEICKKKNLIRAEDNEALKTEIDVVIKMIYGLVKGLDKRKSGEENAGC